MFVYNLLTHKTEGNSVAPGTLPDKSTAPDAIQQSGDAVVWIFPYADVDTFNYQTQSGKGIKIKKGKAVSDNGDEDPAIKLADPIELDPWLTNLSVRQNKDSHVGTLNLVTLDPQNILLASTSPGDIIVCWMFDNHNDAQSLRAKLRARQYTGLNKWGSGLKFVGKVFSARKNVAVLPSGAISKRINILATSFSELDSNIYYDSELATNFFNGLQFMQAIQSYLNENLAHPADVNKVVAGYLAVFLGVGLEGTEYARAQMSRPLKVAPVVGEIFGSPNSDKYIDILQTQVGIQEYTNSYIADGLGKTARIPNSKSTTDSPAKTIQYCPTGLVGWVNPIVQPFNNVPLWGILTQTVNGVANEMYTTLRSDGEGNILPTLMIRQIPFNTDVFKTTHPNIKVTPFRTLPRWKVEDPIVRAYSVGKSDSLRVNFVRIHAISPIPGATDVGLRMEVPPTSDIVDIERNGLRAYVTGINFAFADTAATPTKQWTAMVTDRMMGGQLKYSGSIELAGVQEPIAVGDNLEYDNLVFHIEAVEHSLNVDGISGRKSFSTTLAISNGVPATGALFPEIVNRGAKSNKDGTSKLTGTSSAVYMSNPVQSNGQKDKD